MLQILVANTAHQMRGPFACQFNVIHSTMLTGRRVSRVSE